MKIFVITVGKKHEENLVSAIAEFEKRIKSTTPFEWIFCAPVAVKKEGEIEKALVEEGKSILSYINSDDFVIALDEKGKMYTTKQLSEKISMCLNESWKRMVFVIGGAYGMDGSVKNRANAILSLSHLTFPHQIVRLIITEQIYRALSILQGSKYHHE